MAISFCSKICETFWMTWAFLVVGINYSVVGPTLLDLQLILKENLDKMSTIPLSSGIGEVSGMFFAMWMSRFGHKRLQLGLSLFLASLVITSIPIVPNIIYVDIMFAMLGFISAIPSCFLMDVCSELWQDKGTWFQFILLGSSVGAIFTPLIVEPFLCHRGSGIINLTDPELKTVAKQLCSTGEFVKRQDLCIQYSDNLTSMEPEMSNHDDVFDINSCSCGTLQAASMSTRASKATHEHWTNICQINSESNNVLNSFSKSMQAKCCNLFNSIDRCRKWFRDNENVHGNGTHCTESDTNVRLAYVILGCILLPSSFAFLYFWFQRNSKWGNGEIAESQKQDYDVLNPPIRSKLYKVLLYTLLCLSYLPLTALTILFSTYLTVFGVEGELKLSKSTMVLMTSVFWFTTLAGRIISTVLTPFLGNRTIIILNFGGLIISAFFLILLAPYSDILLWVTTVVFGIFVCAYEGAGLAYASEFLGMSSNLVALSWISVSVGNMIFPFVGGIMFEVFGPTSFLYLLSALVVFMVAMFVMMMILVKKILATEEKCTGQNGTTVKVHQPKRII